MDNPALTPDQVAGGLRQALEQTAAALAAAKLDGLLAAGEALELALAQVSRLTGESAADPDRMRADIDAARSALLRCRRLGISLGDFVRATFDARGVATTYEPSQQAAAALSGRGIDTSV